jgi:probable F420-dependent oxidoreductase
VKLGLNLFRIRPDLMPGLAAQAEALGYESVFVPDHVVLPVHFSSTYPGTEDGAFPYPERTPLYDPFLVLANVAAATRTIRLGTAVYLLALRHPIATARNLVTLEHLAGGRVILGVGVGWLTEEFEALGIDPRSRFSRTEEAMVALRRLLTEEQPSFEGRHFSFRPVHLQPRPVSQPSPPLLYGGDSDAALRRALRFADGWMSGGVTGDVEQIAAALDRIAVLRATLADEDSTLDPARPFDLTVLFPSPTPTDLARLAELGATRVVVMPWERNKDAPGVIERFMDRARGIPGIEPHTD